MFQKFINNLLGENLKVRSLESYYGQRELALRQGIASMSKDDAVQVLLERNLNIVDSFILFLDTVIEKNEGKKGYILPQDKISILCRMVEKCKEINGVTIELETPKTVKDLHLYGGETVFGLKFKSPIEHQEYLMFNEVNGKPRFTISPQY